MEKIVGKLFLTIIYFGHQISAPSLIHFSEILKFLLQTIEFSVLDKLYTISYIHTSFFRDSRSKFFSSFKLLLILSRLRFSMIGFED